MDAILEQFKQSAEKTFIYLKEDFKSIRTGKSNPALLENLIIETYGGQSKLKLLELATIMTEGPTALSVTPFDPATLSDIEKTILKSSLGITPSIQGHRLLAKIPPLSQEQREKLVRLINQKTEEKKNVIRNYRDDARKKIKQLFESKEISEDEKYRIEKDIDSETQKMMEHLQKIRESKEREIMQI
ncbi:ribosome recycling factor [Candidatus Roizmanbacteria bacterium]|nr:ribosome recycling factor [Candidatus Roizmanbacteria bacterium]